MGASLSLVGLDLKKPFCLRAKRVGKAGGDKQKPELPFGSLAFTISFGIRY
jgi:hypothetical protein